MKRIAIVDGVRTPFIKAWTLFNHVSAQKLGASAVKELLEQTEIDPNLIDEVIMGCVGQPAEAANVARVISLYAGIPKSKKAYSVHRNCASGFESVTSAMEKIWAGQDEVVIAGGVESMSNAALHLSKGAQSFLMNLSKARKPAQKLQALSKFRFKHLLPIPSLQLALTDPSCGLNMGQTAEVLAKKFGISRQKQDEFALKSHQNVVKGRENLRQEIMTYYLPPKFEKYVQDDNGVRDNQTMEALAKLRPVFDRRSGTVTAGNSSQITDGACALLIMPEEKAKAMGYEILGTVRDYTYVGVEPSEMGLGPALAIKKVLDRTGMKLSDMELFEINEAFAVQVLACLEAMASKKFASENYKDGQPVGEMNPDLLNVNGGGIALGHPVGVSGSRLILTCLKEMKRRNLHRGLVSLCVGGGQGGALILERE